MEVQRITKANMAKISPKEQIATESTTFNAVMGSKRSEITFERLSKKMAEIEAQGKKLTESHTVENLKKYKTLVKDFLDDAIKNSLHLEEHRGFNGRGSRKIYKLVKEVDKKLIDLTNAVLDKEKKSLDILNVVGEIKGLLINIYT